MRNFIIILSVLSLSACAQMAQYSMQSHSKSAACSEPTDDDTAVRLRVVQDLMQQNRLHAALAHLDDLDTQIIQATYLRAEILRQSDRPDVAKEQYESLLRTCMAGNGHHGLGLIAGREGDFDAAVVSLKKAAELLPIDARVRNDYGYALLLKGDFAAAQREFRTAIELDQDGPSARLAKTNLVVLLFASAQGDKAIELAKNLDLDAQKIARLRMQGVEIMQDIRAAKIPTKVAFPESEADITEPQNNDAATDASDKEADTENAEPEQENSNDKIKPYYDR